MSPAERVRVGVIVRGMVQGVWFRESCRGEADARGVDGWVRNRADGSVEAAFEGTQVAVGEMVGWCKVGPPRAEVAWVEEIDEAPTGERGFRVR